MPLNLMYITNRADVAIIAEKNGVDRIFVDMEYIGKELRQPGDTVKSNHTIDDVKNIKKVLKKAELLVRVNPITEKSIDFCGSEKEISDVMDAGADIIMLPMAKTVEEVEKFSSYVGKRTKTLLLLETPQIAKKIEEVLKAGLVDEVHIGLNDLHLAMGKKFMFELLTDGTVEKLCKTIASFGIPYGFGGIARIGYGMLPAEYIIKEHYRIGSQAAILSRNFCNINNITNVHEIENLFNDGVKKIRDFEKSILNLSQEDFIKNKEKINKLVKKICENIGG